MRKFLNHIEIRLLVFTTGIVLSSWPALGIEKDGLLKGYLYLMGVWGCLVLFLFLAEKGREN